MAEPAGGEAARKMAACRILNGLDADCLNWEQAVQNGADIIAAHIAAAVKGLRESLELGTPERIFVGLMDECEKRGIGSRYAARHVVSQIMQHIDDLTARLAAVQGKDDVNRSLRFLLAQKDEVIADLTARLFAAEQTIKAMAAAQVALSQECDEAEAALAQANQERDDLQAWIDRAERKGAIDANMLSAPDDLTPPPGGRISKDGP